jgi:hypothetical protein
MFSPEDFQVLSNNSTSRTQNTWVSELEPPSNSYGSSGYGSQGGYGSSSDDPWANPPTPKSGYSEEPPF